MKQKRYIRQLVENGIISIRSAAYRLYKMGECSFVPNDREVLRMLNINV